MKTVTEIKASLRRTIELAQAATPPLWDTHEISWRVNAGKIIVADMMTTTSHDRDSDAAHIANACNLSEPIARALLAAIEHNEECLKSFNPNIKADATVRLEAIIAAWQEAWQ